MTLVQFFEFLGFQRGFWSGKWCQMTGKFCNQHTVLIYRTPSGDTALHLRGIGASSYPILFSEQTINIQLLNKLLIGFRLFITKF